MTALDDATRRALEEERDLLLTSLDQLDEERAEGDLDDADFEELRDDYTRRAAVVLRRLDGGGEPETAPPTSARVRAAIRLWQTSAV